MADLPWTGDACSLVDAFRSGERSPVEELDATIAAIEASDLNAFAHLDVDAARALAKEADPAKPFGGVPFGIKELEPVAGWPFTEASLIFADRVAGHDSTHVARIMAGGFVPVGSTTASEFGGLNVSVTKINGITSNPWDRSRTVGGSSCGSAAAVAGGILTIASGGDGGGSIRIPAGYTGLLGMKGTYGRIPRGPHTPLNPHTVVLGCLARSVRDAARYFDVCAGPDDHDPTTLPGLAPGHTWEGDLGSHDLRGRTVVVDPTLGGVGVDPVARQVVEDAAEALVADLGLRRIDVPVEIPRMGAEWMMGNISSLYAEIEHLWPGRADDLTDEIRVGIQLSESLYNMRIAAAGEMLRRDANEAMARLFDEADFVITSTNPGPAFPAGDTMSSAERSFIDLARGGSAQRWGFRAVLKFAQIVAGVFPGLPGRVLRAGVERSPDLLDMGALTMPANLAGNPAVSIPAGTVPSGAGTLLPVGMQVIGRRHADALLFDLALHVERARPWPLVAP